VYSEYDVVVIGAGAAGIGAGRILRERGANYCLLEAKPRLGGRAWTDTDTFNGLPLDKGCHWLHCASQNPLTVFADANGIAYDSTFSFQNTQLVNAGKGVDAKESAIVDKAVETGLRLINEAGVGGLDVSGASVVEALEWNRAYPVFAHILGLITSATPDQLSTLDYSRGDDTGEDYPVRDGLGALVCKLGEGLHVYSCTTATHINWSGRAVRVLTDQGPIRTRSVVLTVSTSVLNSRQIGFTPSLPQTTANALSNCVPGCCEKVAFLLDGPFEGQRDNAYVTVADSTVQHPVPVSLYVNPFGRPVVIADLAGPYMSDLVAEGEPALIAAATRAMVGAFGSDVRGRIVASTATRWTTDEHILGAYSYAKPGYASDRLTLSHPIGDRIFLAGEAVSADAYASCHGAYQSGIEAAGRALESIAV
jgi:monoamine oxidase